MKVDVNGLIKTLNEQKNLIDELRVLASEQLQALKQDDLDKLRSITGHQEYIVRQMAVLEPKRMMILEQYSQELGIEIKHYSEIERYTSSDDFAELQMIRNEIIDNSKKLKEDIVLNYALLKQGLKYADRMLGIFNAKTPFVYGRLGDVHQAGSQGMVDTNV